MFAIDRTFQVGFRHRVLFTEDLFQPANPVLRDTLALRAGGRVRALVVVDANLAAAQPALVNAISNYFQAHGDALALADRPRYMPGGERVKASLEHVLEVLALIDRAHIDRHAYVIGVGGGALLDMVGFAAATAHRGCRHVRVPTTTLSQADSGVGVKNGINVFGKKNFAGTFAPPWAVLNDFNLLASLPPRDKRAGYVEAVKVALIRDRAFFEALEHDAAVLAHFDRTAMQRLIRRCAELHVEHIATGGDPFERGSARPLDFGHWCAHKLEQLTDYDLGHGEAVAIGVALDTLYSARAGLLESTAAERVLNLLERLGFSLSHPALLERDPQSELRILAGLEEFREHLGGELTITLLRDLGVPLDVQAMDRGGMAEVIQELTSRPARP